MNKFEQLKNKIAGLLKSKDDKIKTLEKDLETAKAEPKTALNLKVDQLHVPATISIKDPVEIKNFPQFPHEFAIKNLPKVQRVHLENQKEFPKQIEVSNQKEIQKVEITNKDNQDHLPAWLPDFVGSFLKSLMSGLDRLTNKLFTVKIVQGDNERPLRVMIIDKRGKALDLRELSGNAPIYYPAGTGGSSGGGTVGGALEATQQLVLAMLEDVKTAAENISVDADTINLNTDTLETLIAATNTAIADTLEHYKVADLDDASNPKYYGFTDKAGNWYILKEDTTAKTYRYVKGTSGYDTAVTGGWAMRASHTYDYFHNIF